MKVEYSGVVEETKIYRFVVRRDNGDVVHKDIRVTTNSKGHIFFVEIGESRLNYTELLVLKEFLDKIRFGGDEQ